MTRTDPTQRLAARLAALAASLDDIGRVAVAVSGGVDSMTLACVAHRARATDAAMFHAVSPAVPPEATARVRAHAARHGWSLSVFDAGEFADPDYLRNPVDRCFYCKTSLYGSVAPRAAGATVVSGTNLDDLGDYRPGLRAAAAHGVRHPFVEAGIDKATVRAIAGSLGLTDLAELPAAPCLSSRIETGTPVTAPALAFIHAVEGFVAAQLRPRTVRCRVRAAGPAVELDDESLARLRSTAGAAIRDAIALLAQRHGYGAIVRYETYRMGSAFRRPAT